MGGKLAVEELSALKSLWLLLRDEKQLLGRKDGSEVLLALAAQSRKGRPFLHEGPHHGKFSMWLGNPAGNRLALARHGQSLRARAELSHACPVTDLAGKGCRYRDL